MTNREGSPPHGRGKGACTGQRANTHRITPAWAGKSRLRRYRAGAGGDHPRMGGEKFSILEKVAVIRGSPPHGRGKGYNTLGAIQQGRITPAWAGKSNAICYTPFLYRDHPRMGGEKFRCML